MEIINKLNQLFNIRFGATFKFTVDTTIKDGCTTFSVSIVDRKTSKQETFYVVCISNIQKSFEQIIDEFEILFIQELLFSNKTTKRANKLGVRKTFRDFVDIIIKDKNL